MASTLTYAVSLVPEIADDIASVDRAMRLGYNMKWGPFELLDRIGPAWFRSRLEAEGIEVPALLRAVGEGSFYRVEDGRLQHLDRGGRLCRRRAAGRRAAARGRQAPRRAAGEERLGEPLGHRRRRRLPRVPQQDECDRPRHARHGRQGGRDRRQGFQGPGGLQRGRQLLGRRQYRHRAVRRECRRLADDRGYGRQRPDRPTASSSTAAFRWSPRHPAWRSAAAARSA